MSYCTLNCFLNKEETCNTDCLQDDRSVKSNLSKQVTDVAFHFDLDITYSSLPPRARVDNQDQDDDYAARRWRAQKTVDYLVKAN